MVFSKNSNKKILKLLALSFLVTSLLVVPSLLGNHLNFFIEPPAGKLSAYAQTPVEPEPLQEGNIDGQPEGNTDSPPISTQTEAQQIESDEKAQTQQGNEEKKGELDVFKIVMGLLAGLVLFLYGVTRMAEGLKQAGGDRAKNLLSKFTKNRFAGVLTGTAATTVLDSSSVTIIMTIAMVSAGLLTFVQSLGVVLGSNIGTTIGAEIIAFEINQYAPIALLIGAGLHFLGKTDRWKNIGLVVFGFGLIFFGLDVIGDAMKPFESYQPFLTWMTKLGEKPLLGALVGALFTVAIQSSSATVAIVITLASQGLISLPAGVALMLGAEVGTCADTLVATIGRERPAVRTGVFHLIFNVVTATVGIFFAAQLAALAQWISGEADVARQIANAQVIFNVLGVIAFIGFLPWIARSLEKLIPDTNQAQQNQSNSEPEIKSDLKASASKVRPK